MFLSFSVLMLPQMYVNNFHKKMSFNKEHTHIIDLNLRSPENSISTSQCPYRDYILNLTDSSEKSSDCLVSRVNDSEGNAHPSYNDTTLEHPASNVEKNPSFLFFTRYQRFFFTS